MHKVCMPATSSGSQCQGWLFNNRNQSKKARQAARIGTTGRPAMARQATTWHDRPTRWLDRPQHGTTGHNHGSACKAASRVTCFVTLPRHSAAQHRQESSFKNPIQAQISKTSRSTTCARQAHTTHPCRNVRHTLTEGSDMGWLETTRGE
jgi:hypothetical protein